MINEEILGEMQEREREREREQGMHRNDRNAAAGFESRWRSYRMQRARYMLPVGTMGGVVCPVGGCPFGSSAGYLPIYLSPREPAADGRVLRIVRERARVYARFRRDST